MDRTLEQLLGSKARIRVLRFFFNHPGEFFSLKEVSQKTKLGRPPVRKELTRLKQIRFLKTKFIQLGKSRRKEVWGVNTEFTLWKELKNLVLTSSGDLLSSITTEIKRLGAVKLAILGGVFVNQKNTRVDILIVVGKSSQRKVNSFIGNLEAESGRDINCVVITPSEFSYRYNLYDRVVRDMLSPKNIRVIDKITNV